MGLSVVKAVYHPYYVWMFKRPQYSHFIIIACLFNAYSLDCYLLNGALSQSFKDY